MTRPLRAPLLRTRPANNLKHRVSLGVSGLSVSPFCLGMIAQPEIVPAAYQAGINFFFLSADMHWPLYEPLRVGLRMLLRSSPSVRSKVVVAVVSYVTQPEFCFEPFEEVLHAVPELGYVDLAVIGGTYASDFLTRRERYLEQRPGRMRALGATFHERRLALTAVNRELVDLAFIRYNSAHAGAEAEVFPHLHVDRKAKLFNFKSTSGLVDPDRLAALGLPNNQWRPTHTDHYRFALRRPELDGVLCGFQNAEEITALQRALKQPPLTAKEAKYLKSLSALDAGLVEVSEASE